ncbi:hypothetical protein SCWH03_48860 [Streptomyces pacificus]|uniref:Uncharacterized protein n=1 Tax=Streptomyces pacificus TaxID=2705029 RepID=A0A6A0B227_9ACTN|nr:hypothetical protein SCWH03_48860 [Streptomyces pacificus]
MLRFRPVPRLRPVLRGLDGKDRCGPVPRACRSADPARLPVPYLARAGLRDGEGR